MTRAQKFALGILSFFACNLWLVILSATSQAYQVWRQQPLGPTLAYPTQWQLPATWTASPASTPEATQPTVTLVPTLPFETQTPIPPLLACNNDSTTITVLAIGTDVRPGERRYGLSDVMRAIRVDFQQQHVTTLEFPRDLWVRIPGIENNLGTNHQKLNTAYAYGSPDHGVSLLARTLNLNFGLNVDHYVGGLDLVIPPGGIDGRTRTDRSERLVFPEGPQHLNGEQALTLARLRNASVFARAENQNLVMCALRKKIESPEVILRLPAIINSFLKNIQTDLTLEQIVWARRCRAATSYLLLSRANSFILARYMIRSLIKMFLSGMPTLTGCISMSPNSKRELGHLLLLPELPNQRQPPVNKRCIMEELGNSDLLL
jgi:LCP family protein required for cell wall assembly